LARGPWDPEEILVSWRTEPFEPDPSSTEQADRLLDELRDRGSPSHDGQAARLVSYEMANGTLRLELQPVRWALRLLPYNAAASMSALCVVRSADGNWLAGRRADWLATWAGRWALGAAGSVEVDEHPARTLGRELQEEWSVSPERLTVEALIRLPSGLVMLVGQAWLSPGARVTPDHEHDEYAWWPAEPERWPDEADAPLLALSAIVAGRGSGS
jgi:ADP-ribose pyrophosphatase YjhB (NUDIX family)